MADPICRFCQARTADEEEAIDAGWAPYFYDGDAEHEGPICPDCIRRYLVRGFDGELDLRPDAPDLPIVLGGN